MDESERRAAGLKIRRKVLGDAHVDRAIARTTALTEDFQDLLTRYAWGEIWARPGLDVRSRRVLVLGTLVALGRWEEFGMHARAALTEGGFSAGDLQESCCSRRSIAACPPRTRRSRCCERSAMGGYSPQR